MPRIPTPLLRRAYDINPLLPLLLRTVRDLPSAHNELRWLREHTFAITGPLKAGSGRSPWKALLYRLCVERSKGKPLQYILGNQPFGELEIICRKGVLIPRPETESYTTRIARLILKSFVGNRSSPTNEPSTGEPKLRVLDLCTGTGCISLLLHALLSKRFSRLEILGIDISPKAISLASQNLHHNIAMGHLAPIAKKQVRFLKRDVFRYYDFAESEWDLVISNPPYISPRGFNRDTSRSVRSYEPRTALVPPHDIDVPDELDVAEKDFSIGDAFYPTLLDIAEWTNGQILVAEVADMEQARRVVTRAVTRNHWNKLEIWRDWPDCRMVSDCVISGTTIKVIGEGNGRSVLAWKSGHIQALNEQQHRNDL